MQGLCCLGKCSPATPCQHSTPSALPKVSVRKPFFSFSFFFVLISSNKNNEFLKPCKNVTRCQQSQPEGDVWPMGCSSHKSLHKPALQRMGPATRAQNASSLHPQTGAPHTHPHSIAPVTLPATDWLAQGLGSFPSVTNTAHSGAQHNSCALGMLG